MENIDTVITALTSIVVLLGTATGFIIGIIKAIKSKSIAVNKITLAEGLFAAIQEAEGFLEMSGEEKKDYVLKKVEEFSGANKIPFDIDAVEKAIESIIDFTRKVNKNKS